MVIILWIKPWKHHSRCWAWSCQSPLPSRHSLTSNSAVSPNKAIIRLCFVLSQPAYEGKPNRAVECRMRFNPGAVHLCRMAGCLEACKDLLDGCDRGSESPTGGVTFQSLIPNIADSQRQWRFMPSIRKHSAAAFNLPESSKALLNLSRRPPPWLSF